jgi:hypothetical protein
MPTQNNIEAISPVQKIYINKSTYNGSAANFGVYIRIYLTSIYKPIKKIGEYPPLKVLTGQKP